MWRQYGGHIVYCYYYSLQLKCVCVCVYSVIKTFSFCSSSFSLCLQLVNFTVASTFAFGAIRSTIIWLWLYEAFIHTKMSGLFEVMFEKILPQENYRFTLPINYYNLHSFTTPAKRFIKRNFKNAWILIGLLVVNRRT